MIFVTRFDTNLNRHLEKTEHESFIHCSRNTIR